MQARTMVIVALVLICTAGCGPVYQTVRPTPANMNQIKRLAIVVPQPESHVVFYERAKATATPAIMFGVIGASIASAHNKSLDNELAQQLSPALRDFSIRSVLVSSLSKTLDESQRFETVKVFDTLADGKNIAGFDAVATIIITNWGFRLVERGQMEIMSPFVELEATMAGSTGAAIWDEHDTSIGRGRHLLGDYMSNAELVNTDMKEAAESAGYRLAVTLLYPKGAK